MPEKERKTITFITDMDEAHAIMDAQKADNLVIKHTVGGKEFKIVEIQRKLGPGGFADTNNNVC